jgi:tetratricopeptide (TPR) repeat protein
MKEPTRKKYTACICAIVKDESPYLLEWIAYHRIIGIDHFFIYDNESEDGSQELLKQLDKAGVITYLNWPDASDGNTQQNAYSDCAKRARDITEWIAFIDADEFILPHKHQNLKAFLEDYSDVDAIAINWKIFGSSEKRYREAGLLMERFTKCSEKDFNANGHIKTIVKKITDLKYIGIHACVFHSHKNKKYIYPDRVDVPKTKFTGKGKYIDHSIIQINHYYSKSFEEFNFKRVRGRPTVKRDDPRILGKDIIAFQMHDRNLTEDVKILPFVEPTKTEIKKLKSLAELDKIEDLLNKFRKDYEQELIDKKTQLFYFSSHEEFKNGNRLMNLGKLDEAIAAYRCSLKFNSTFSWSYYKLGEALTKKGDLESAVKEYNNCLKLNPNSAWSHYQLGLLLVKTGDLEEGINCLQKAVEINPYFHQFYNSLGEVLEMKGDLKQAINYYQKATELNGKSDRAYLNLGIALEKQNQHQKAIESCQQAIKLNKFCASKIPASILKEAIV